MTGPSPSLSRSRYDRGACRLGIVHVGFGAFHRAHQAVYVDDYMARSGDMNWGIAAVNLRPEDSAAFRRASAGADGYVLRTLSSAGDAAHRVIRAHLAFEDWSAEPDPAEALIALRSVSIVTITVTESGYAIGRDGGLDRADPAIAAELDGAPGRSVYAYLRAGLDRRRAAGGGPISILCCDNIRRNGKMLKQNFFAYLEAVGASALIDWLRAHASFPCAMVDRITPKPTAALSEEVGRLFDRPGDPSVMAEDFIQWVIEDDFAGPRPRLEEVGATIAADVDPYEEAKIRILNGGHTGLTYLGALAGWRTFDEAMADPALNAHFWAFERDDVLPALDLELPFDKSAYLETIARRFQNANIGDTVERICADGYAKMPVFIRPTLEGAYAQGRRPSHALRSVASWLVFARRVASGALDFRYTEPNAAALAPLLPEANFDAFAASEPLWGDLPRREPSFKRLLAEQVAYVEATWPA